MPSGGRHLRHSVLLNQSDPDIMDNVDDSIRSHKNPVSAREIGEGGGSECSGDRRGRRKGIEYIGIGE